MKRKPKETDSADSARKREENQSAQNETPLIDALRDFRARKPAFFRIPGHRFERGADKRALRLMGKKAYASDLTEAEGLDDLHQPTGVIRKAEELAADLYGSEHCWFLVNGTTCGNEAIILACVQPGEKILIARNAHKSALMGLILSGAVPIWLEPVYDPDFGIYGEVSPAEVQKALQKHPDVRGIFLTSPTYYGILSDIKAISEMAHAHGIPLCVDEAHGAHLYFSNRLPAGALKQGADIVCQSTHKTVGSFTQSSMLHLRGQRLNPERVDDCLKLVMSTSPSYLLMASLDGARHFMATRGEKLISKALRRATWIREKLGKIEGIQLLRGSVDPLRIVFSVRSLGITGYRMQELLYEGYGVSTELADFYSVVLVLTWGNTKDDIKRLIRAVQSLASVLRSSASAPTTAGDSAIREELLHQSLQISAEAPLFTPREAFYAKKSRMNLMEAVGQVAGESLIPYPPGIPLVCPGERIRRESLEFIQILREQGVGIHGLSDPEGRSILVILE